MHDTTTHMIDVAMRSDESINEPTRKRIREFIAGGGEVKPGRKPDRIIRRSEAAQRLAVSTRSIDLYAKRGILVKVKLPGQSRANGFRESELEALIEGRKN